MAYDFTLDEATLVVTFDTESGRFSENIHEYLQPNLVLGSDRVYLKESARFVQDFIFEDIGLINGDEAGDLIQAYEMLNAMARSLYVEEIPTNIGYTSATGVVTSSTGTGFTLPLATASVRGLMSDADFDKINEIPEFADNAEAVTGSLAVGMFYRTGDVLKVVHA